MGIEDALRIANDPQYRRYADSIKTHGSYNAAAAALGRNRSSVYRAICSLEREAARRGYAPTCDQQHPVPEGQLVKGVSTLYDADGQVRLQWVKTLTEREQELQEALELFAGELAEDFEPAKLIAPPKAKQEERLLVVYPMGDPHIGMYAWHEEAGENFDLNTACQDLSNAMQRLVNSAPAAQTALIINLGDFFHADNYQGTTSRSGNSLDVDTRWPKVLRLGSRLMMDCVSLALQRHEKVIVRNVIGNHDDHSSVALSLIMDAYWRDDPRVEVSIDPGQFWYYEFGTTLIGATHGHNIKPDRLPLIMAQDRQQAWGRTDHRYWYTGHIHHRKALEFNGAMVETFRTLAARDAYTTGAGYRSGRDMHMIAIHEEYGEIARHRVDIRMARGEHHVD